MRYAIALFLGLTLQPVFAAEGRDSEQRATLWVKVVDQHANPIDGANVYYCSKDCNTQDRAITGVTNRDGLLQFPLEGKNRAQIRGISKDGYDIRLSNLGYTQIRLEGTESEPDIKRLDWQSNIPGFGVEFGPKVAPFSLPASRPVVVVTGWKFGPAACLERGHAVIDPDGPYHIGSEQGWTIDDKQYFFKVGNGDHPLRESDPRDFDFKVVVNRHFYPWKNLIYRELSSYRLDVVFREGGAQRVEPSRYMHVAPEYGYAGTYTIKSRGLGEISGSYLQKTFVKIGDRYGVLYLKVRPSLSITIEYLLNRKPAERALNIPAFFGGREYDYLDCPRRASASPNITPPGECALLGKPPCHESWD